MSVNLPPKAQNLLAQLQQQQALYENVVQQLTLYQAELNELKRVKSELEKLPDDAEIFRNIGHVLVKTTKQEAIKDVENKIELLEIKLASLKKQEEMIRKEIQRLKEELNKVMGAGAIGGG
ncbi:prefoldin subunit beta [Ignicoccus islandicus DSM 13165]|uniref:Prefoldin subunit beta n=1 Tax=Ignicoccus islandicus DSM 13165 TaxID=940295 RepID=A0A0U2U6N5_9CREN|nr:prefoldin subunit beta [Ignicoccus islandicus]ALU11812.1 prefoldin subunit beta [Ignicoccus islandicus DSM 13165]